MRNKNFWKVLFTGVSVSAVTMLATVNAFAEDTASQAEEPSTFAMLMSTFGLPILLLVFLYFFLLRPQQKQDKDAKAMRSSLQVGDEVITSGGIVGIVLRIEESTDTIILETGSDRLKIRLLREAIVRNITAQEAAEAEKESKKKAKMAKATGKEN